MDSEALRAVRKGDLPKLKERLDLGINVNDQDSNGRTLLHHAASHCQHKVVKYLLQNGADVLLTTRKNNTALHISATRDNGIMTSASILVNSNRHTIKKLLDVKTENTGSTALHIATILTKHQSLLLLFFGANFEITNKAGEKPADLAITAGNRLLYQLIGANFEMAEVGRRKILANLLKFKEYAFSAMLNCRNNKGLTLVQVLLTNTHVDLAREIMRMRIMQPMSKAQGLVLEPRFGREIDRLFEQAKQCKEFWIEQRDQIMSDVKESPEGEHISRMADEMFQKALYLLFTYWEFEDEHKLLTLNENMKTIGEVLELFNFDPNTFSLIEDENRDECYSNKKLKKVLFLFMEHVGHAIYPSISYFARDLNVAQMFHVVKENDSKRVKRLLENAAPTGDVDHTGRTVLCYAAENGNRKIVELLLESGEKILQEGTLSPIYLSAREGHAEIVKLLLEKADPERLPEFIDWRPKPDGPCDDIGKYLDLCTALHVAATRGRLDIVKMLLRHGATYLVFDEDKRTPLQVSTSMEVNVFLKLVEYCFEKAKEANVELLTILKSMQIDDFMAVTGTRNHDGQTLAVVAANANAKNISKMILKIIRRAKHK